RSRSCPSWSPSRSCSGCWRRGCCTGWSPSARPCSPVSPPDDARRAMDVEPLLPWMACVLLLTVRLTAALARPPAFTAFGLRLSVRLALTCAVAALVFADGRPVPQAQAWLADPLRLAWPVLVELGIGALMGLSVQVVLAAFSVAGRLMDVQAGFAIGSIFDPLT